MRVRIGWEHTHRELLPLLLLMHHLRARGIPSEPQHVRGLRPYGGREMLLIPFYYDDSDLLRYLFRCGIHGKWVVNLAYEQMHPRGARAYLLPDGRIAREQMLHCAWGPRFRELLMAHGIPAERIRITGHPRFDVYSSPSLLLPRADLAERFGLDADKPWVLIPANFNLAYISEKHRRYLVSRRYDVGPDMVEAAATARDAFVELVRVLCERFPGLEIILRVHPAGYESTAFYRGAGQTHTNLHLIAQYDIANWITQAALTVVWNSTSSMEALVAGRPVVSYEPEPYAERYDYDVSRILHTVSSLDAVVDIAARLPGELDLPADWTRFKRWYQYRDGKCLERLADVAVEAQGDFAAFKAEMPGGLGAAGRWRRLRDRIETALPPALLRIIAGNHKPQPAPAPADVEAAVRSLSPTPLLEFLK